MEDSLKYGRCPKCGSVRVYSSDNDVTQVLPTSHTGLDKPRIDNYACGDCGYTEFYITPDTLHILDERWSRVDQIDDTTAP